MTPTVIRGAGRIQPPHLQAIVGRKRNLLGQTNAAARKRQESNVGDARLRKTPGCVIQAVERAELCYPTDDGDMAQRWAGNANTGIAPKRNKEKHTTKNSAIFGSCTITWSRARMPCRLKPAASWSLSWSNPRQIQRRMPHISHKREGY